MTTQRDQDTADNGVSMKLSGPQTYLQLLVAREEREHVLVDLRQLKTQMFFYHMSQDK